MIPKIAIRGRKQQSNLVIKYLEKLGGRNENKWIGDDTQGYYWIDDINRIRCTNEIPVGYKFVDIWPEPIHKENNKYILVEFPESQKYIGNKECHVCSEIACAIFVPEDIYNKITNNG